MPRKQDKVVKVETFVVAPRWLFVRIETARGFIGWGEGTLEGRSETVAMAIEQMLPFLIGADPDNIAYIHQAISVQPFYHGDSVHRSALSGIDIALWDIKGKRLKSPIHMLLGGMVNDTIRCYRWFGGNVPQAVNTSSQKSAVHMLRELMKGRDPNEWSYFKMNACPSMGPVDNDGAIEHAESVLKALAAEIGDRKIKFGIDCHGRMRPGSVRQFLHMAEKYSNIVYFVEEPLPVEEIDSMAQLRQFTSLRLATGERFYLPSDFMRLGAACASDIYQPDLGHCGGITAGKQIADIANNCGVGFAPHCPNGPMLLAASLQVQISTPACMTQETSIGIHYNCKRDAGWYVHNPEVLIPDNRGFLPALRGYGLGIEVNEARVRSAARKGPTWQESSCYVVDRVGGCPRAW